MPEGRSGIFKFLPKPGANLSVTFGKPIEADAVRDALRSIVRDDDLPDPPRTLHPNKPKHEATSAKIAETAWLGAAAFSEGKVQLGSAEEGELAMEVRRVRIAVTALMQQHVEALGREVIARQRGS